MPEAARITIEVGDITKSHVDAIVNAANGSLLPGGGVCGAIHAAGGASIAQECAEIIKRRYPGGLPAGQAVATTGGRLPAEHVIHAVGPIYHQDHDPDRTLADTYRSSLAVAAELGAKSIAFPAISTGIYGFPPQRAAAIVWRTLLDDPADLDIHLVFFSAHDREVFEAHRGAG